MEKNFEENNKKLKQWIKPSINKLSLSDTQSGTVLTKSERAKTSEYGGS